MICRYAPGTPRVVHAPGVFGVDRDIGSFRWRVFWFVGKTGVSPIGMKCGTQLMTFLSWDAIAKMGGAFIIRL